jgi:formamidopyrimidine-DNA glycosylase
VRNGARCRLVADASHCTARGALPFQIVCVGGLTPAQLSAALLGAKIVAVHRKGKHLWCVPPAVSTKHASSTLPCSRWELDRRPWPSFHFGMTGSFVVRGVAAPVYKSFAVDESAWPPRFTKLHLELSGGGAVAFSDARRFARIRLQQNPATEAPVSELGWDALLEAPSPEAFAAALSKRGAPIKAVLLDQSFAAGVGNWVADEVRPACCRCFSLHMCI